MKKYLTFSLTFFIVLLSIFNGNAQSTENLDRVIQSIEYSDFTEAYVDAKEKMEAQISMFKLRRNEFSKEDVADVRRMYAESRYKFDQILEDLKEDFTKRKYRKLIRKYPNAFLQSKLVNDFKVAVNTYNNSCKMKIDALLYTGEAGFDPSLILLIWGLADKTSDLIANMKAAKVEEHKAYFEYNYAREKRVKSWEVL